MKNMEILKKELNDLKSEREAINYKINIKLLDLAECCPINMGDKVTVTGYSHTGKYMIVDSINYHERKCYGEEPTQFLCTGYVVKKDGTTGVHVGEHRC